MLPCNVFVLRFFTHVDRCGTRQAARSVELDKRCGELLRANEVYDAQLRSTSSDRDELRIRLMEVCRLVVLSFSYYLFGKWLLPRQSYSIQ